MIETHRYLKVRPFLRAIQYLPGILLHEHLGQELPRYSRGKGGLSDLYGPAEQTWSAAAVEVVDGRHTHAVTFPLHSHEEE